MIEDGIGDIATAYWAHMHAKGLVDVLLDDEGAQIEVDANEAVRLRPTAYKDTM